MNKELENVSIDYKQLMGGFRELARNLLRMRWINNIMDAMLDTNKSISALEEDIARYTKSIEVCRYAINKLDIDNPNYDTLLMGEEEQIKIYEKNIEDLNERINKLQEEKQIQLDKIAKVESGELKVDAENLSVKAKELLEANFRQQAAEIK
jgi:chromosome segregation ATPase